ncbi:hypothetical protein T11_14295 [Trichinella zimbabwensis]|uniref:Uncharacterized protein n=1 Tax=Trichinella zimbabwensis TaxID=268475 RepID=A0A0V1HLG2_9BILA|nr:hypothetical protein T11_14295 [Trichinella zimbabwensis]
MARYTSLDATPPVKRATKSRSDTPALCPNSTTSWAYCLMILEGVFPCLSDQVLLTAYRITQQVPPDDAIVRFQYTASAEEVFQLLQPLRRVQLLTKDQKRAKAGAACTHLYSFSDRPQM